MVTHEEHVARRARRRIQMKDGLICSDLSTEREGSGLKKTNNDAQEKIS
jgi:ABC-type lipoprotein export system ATPase subunit